METEVLARIAAALERLAPPEAPSPELTGADAFVWRPPALRPVAAVASVPLDLLLGLERQKEALLGNTLRFAAGFAANNAMLWGARGMGKSSLVKAVHAVCPPGGVALVEIAREDLGSLPVLLSSLRDQPRRCVVFCDDLSFERGESAYKALKSVLDGGIQGRPPNVLFYATSNRRHLVAREMDQDDRAVSARDGVDEVISLSDRFGLWLGFHGCDQPTFLAMVDGYVAARALTIDRSQLHEAAIAWSIARGARSGRVAVQFVDDLEGRLSLSERWQ